MSSDRCNKPTYQLHVAFLLALCLLLTLLFLSSSYFPPPPGGPTFSPYGNPIDDCWMSSDWRSNPKQLANCAVGFGKDTRGGQAGDMYVVTTNEDDPVNPRPGSLRYGMTRVSEG